MPVIHARPFLLALPALILTACTAPTQQKPHPTLDSALNKVADEPISATDACASRMHDIEGALLLYYLDHKKLPANLDELQAMPDLDEPLAFTCPVSKLPYIYNPGGIMLPEKNGRIILYDAAPSHSGMRWAIRIDDPSKDQPLVARVVALPESFFLLRPPARRPNAEPAAQPPAPPQQ